jgi:hypothetical protein
MHVIGGKLSSSGPPFYFHPSRVNILVTNLPIGWPAHACRTFTHESAPKLRFAFSDGLTTSDKLVASGYTLDGRRAGRSSFPGYTYIKLCRDARGRPAAFAIQVTYYKFVSNVIHAYSVYAENNGAGGGRSSVDEAALFEGENGTDATASSKVANLFQVWP